MDRGLRFGEPDKFGLHFASLMHQLVKTVLSVGSRFAQNDWTSLDAGSQANTLSRDSFPIAFHVELLDVGWETKQSL